MNERLAVLLLTALANLLLGIFGWWRRPSSRINQYFAIFSTAVAVWTISNALVSIYAATQWGTFWARAAFAAATIIPLSFFLFVSAFPSGATIRWRPAAVAISVSSATVFLLSFTPLIARGTRSVDGVLSVSYGPLHPVFGAYFVLSLGYSLLILARKARTLKGLGKLQVRYVFVAVLIAGLGATVTNLLIPLLLNSSRFSPYGPVFSILMMALIAHSIIRYRLMDIRLVIRRGVTYLLAVAIAGSVLAFSSWVTSLALLSTRRDFPLWLILFLALLMAPLFQRLKDSIQRLLDSYVFRELYDYQQTVRSISRTMATLLDLESLLDFTWKAVSRTVRPEGLAVYILDPTGAAYGRVLSRSGIPLIEREDNIAIPIAASLPRLLSARKTHILRDELKQGPRTSDRSASEDALDDLGAELVLPILHDDCLSGFFVLGPKLSGDPYFSEDIDLLSTLVSQAAISIRNAQLYSQVVLVNEYVENILATMDSAVIAVSAEGTVTLSNSSAMRLTGRGLQGAHLSALPTPISASLGLTLLDCRPRTQIETDIQDTTGGITPIICSTSPLKDRSGAILGAVAVFSDLTHLKRLEAEKQQAERLASIGALASGLAHEIKNPLVAIKTFAELLPERFSEEDFRNDFLKVVVCEIDRIDDLVRRLRGLAAPTRQHLSPLDIRVPLEETLALVRGQLEQSRTEVSVLLASDLPLIAGDPAQLKQLFLNIVVNALEAMDLGGKLSIRISPRYYNAGPSVVVEVSDSGTGISEDLLPRIFDPFVTTKQRGSGLGLSICRGITDSHRATIAARNNPSGPGTIVVIEFPSVQEAASPTGVLQSD